MRLERKTIKRKMLSLLLAFTLIVGCIPMTMQVEAADETKGMEFSDATTLHVTEKSLAVMPKTFEADVYFPADFTGRGGVILGNYGSGTLDYLSFEINSGGVPRLFMETAADGQVDTQFTEINVYTGEWIHLAIVVESEAVKCYVDGALKQTIEKTLPTLTCNSPMVLGGDHRSGNGQNFKGRIASVAWYSDARTAEEIAADVTAYGTEDLILEYDLENVAANATVIEDKTANNYDAKITRNSWISTEEKAAVADYDYSFAVIGDIQNLNYQSAGNTDYLSSMYDWIADNVDEKNIQLVMGLGDITENNTDAEWMRAKENHEKLDGLVPYSVIRGNHDTYEQFEKFFPYAEQENKLGGSFDGTINNTWQEIVIDVSGNTIKYLVFALDYGASDEVLAWAGDIIGKNPNHNVIITTHAYLYGTSGTLGTDDIWTFESDGRSLGNNNGDDIWDKLISQYSNISMVLCGHDPQDNIVMTKTRGTNGNVVTQMLIDPQSMDKADPVGMVAMLYFSEGGSKVEVEYYSTVKDMYWKSCNQFTTDVEIVDSYAASFTEGITFENAADMSVIFGNTGDNAINLEKVKYAEEDEEVVSAMPSSEFGTYGIKGDATGKNYPEFKLNYGETLPAGSKLEFWTYVKANPETTEGVTVKLEKKRTTSKWPIGCDEFALNQWVKIEFELDATINYDSIFFNLYNKFATDEEVTVYLDNFKVTLPEGEETQTGSVIYELRDDVAGFRGETKTYPTGKAGYVFAGWYQLENGEYVALSSAKADAATSAYAKFVDRDVLSTKYQLTANTTSFSDTTKLRMLTTVESLDYASVGFRLTIGEKTRDLTSDVVYKEISAFVDGNGKTYQPNVFASISKYFMTHSISGIPNSAFAMGFRIEPIWTTLDGTVVSGVAKNFTISDVVPDWEGGIDFEDAGDAGMFTGQGATTDATITRVSYKDAGIAAPEGGKKMALAISSTTIKYPAFQVNFGEEVPIGTELKFMAYAVVDGAATAAQTRFEETETNPKSYKANVVSTEDMTNGNFTVGTWTEITVRMNAAGENVQLFWNADCAGAGYGTVYVDNVRVILPEGNFYTGVGFEEDGNAGLVYGQRVEGTLWADAQFQQISYAKTGLSAPVGGGAYALRISPITHSAPRFVIDLGQTVPANSQLKFMAYVDAEPSTTVDGRNQTRFILDGISSGKGTIVSTEDVTNNGLFTNKTWAEITVTLTEETDKVVFYWDLYYGQVGLNGTLYIDNIRISQGEFRDGVDFEATTDAALFEGAETHGDTSYAVVERFQYDETVTAPTEGGTYGLKLSSTKDKWPNFIMNFGQELPIGTKVTFMAYGVVDGTLTNDYTRFEAQGISKDKATVSTSENHAKGSDCFTVKKWTKITVTLTEAAESLELFWNYELTKTDTISGAVYVDNFKAILPEDVITNGIDFETEDDTAFFKGAETYGSEYLTLERVSYKDAGISAPTNGGAYGLAMSTETSSWPDIEINFGTVLRAGTTITFDAYGVVDGAVDYEDTRFEAIGYSTGKMYTTSVDASDQNGLFTLGKWKEVTITLLEDVTCVYLHWNIGIALSGAKNGTVYVDNFEITEPEDIWTIKAGLEGKSALFIGHSIAAGVTDNDWPYTDCKGWAGRMAQYYDMQVVNNAVSGACISNVLESQSSDLYIYNQLDTSKQYDYVIMQGFWNDYWQRENADLEAFGSALALLFDTARQQNPDAKLGYIIDYSLPGQDATIAETYVTKAIEICNEKNVSYLDLYHDTTCVVNTHIELADSTHPSTRGYEQTFSKISTWMADMAN